MSVVLTAGGEPTPGRFIACFSQAPCCLNEFEFVGGQIYIWRVNETWHLQGIKRSQQPITSS